MLLTALTIALVAAAGAASPAPSPAAGGGLSRDQAEALRGRVLELERHARRPRPRGITPPSVLVTQGELNSYVNLVLGPQLPAGLRDVDFRFEDGRIKARGMVDLDKVKSQLGATSVWNPLTLLSGVVSVELAGRLKSDGGFGTFALDDIRLGPVAIPAPLLAQIVASATRTQQNPAGFDILSPFRLPYSLKKVRIQSGRVSLDY